VTRRRLDRELVRRGLAETLTEALAAIEAGRVTVEGRPATTPASMVDPGEAVTVHGPPRPYVSRGGEKLAPALGRFGIRPGGRRCLDAGASTGGFADVLLRAGAAHVVTVDVGYGQLAWPLRTDPRVTVLERTNVRLLEPGDLPYRPDLITADLSFISLTAAVPALARSAAPRADLVLLVKPQFEAGRQEVHRGGVVTDPAAWRAAVDRVAEACRAAGAGPIDVMASPLTGPAGNVEFLLHARTDHPGGELDVDGAIAEAPQARRTG
jgi:23S rRNA (cytidine1920-2'-O)/16S rRNA (cytidine1409-2'-O)-methyltransferase